MFALFERMVAWRYLRSRRKEGFISVISWFSLLGIGLGVATLIIVMAVMNGFREELFARVLGLNGHLNLYGQSGNLQHYEGLAAGLAGIKGVERVVPMVEGQALVSAHGNASGAVVRGLDLSDLQAKDAIARHVQLGKLTALNEPNTVAIGIRMAERLNVDVGGSITLLSPSGIATAFGTMPRLQAFKIGAIYNVGMFEYDNNFVFMPLSIAQNFFGMGNGITTLELMVADPHHLQPLYDAVVRLADAKAPQRVRLLTWQDARASFVNALQVERNVMFLILTLIIVVAAFNIVSSMIMLVKDKGHAIAILRTMGASRGSIMRIFFLSGASIGVVGTALGLGLGVCFSLNIEAIRQFLQHLTGTDLFSAEIYFLSTLPARLDWAEVGQVVLIALGLSFAATLYPSWRAANLDPVEALRYE